MSDDYWSSVLAGVLLAPFMVAIWFGLIRGAIELIRLVGRSGSSERQGPARPRQHGWVLLVATVLAIGQTNSQSNQTGDPMYVGTSDVLVLFLVAVIIGLLINAVRNAVRRRKKRRMEFDTGTGGSMDVSPPSEDSPRATVGGTGEEFNLLYPNDGYEMDFQEVDHHYAQLKRQYDAAALSPEEFDARLQQLMVQDQQGRWWIKARETGQWMYHTGSTWVQGTPKPSGVPSGLEGNTSGMGGAAVIPREIRRWNWGAFLLGWIWAFGNGATGIAVLGLLINLLGGLLFFLPNLIMWFVFGGMGNEWAWRSKRWDSIEHFRSTQRKWAWAGLIVLAAWWLLIISIGVIADIAEGTGPTP